MSEHLPDTRGGPGCDPQHPMNQQAEQEQNTLWWESHSFGFVSPTGEEARWSQMVFGHKRLRNRRQVRSCPVRRNDIAGPCPESGAKRHGRTALWNLKVITTTCKRVRVGVTCPKSHSSRAEEQPGKRKGEKPHFWLGSADQSSNTGFRNLTLERPEIQVSCTLNTKSSPGETAGSRPQNPSTVSPQPTQPCHPQNT